jgi:TPR repeat protein
MGSFGKHRFPAATRHGVRLALCLALCGAALSGRASPASPAQSAGLSAPPPVPLYSTGVTKTTIFGPGMIVISTRDSFETVLEWYRINLKGREADVALDPRHHRYVTHDGASVDVSVDGSGADAETKISLFWNSADALSPPGPAPEPVRAGGLQPLAALAGVEPLPQPAEPALAALTAARIEPMPPRPADAGQADPKASDLQALAYLKEGRYGEALLAWEDAAANGSAAAALDLGMMYDAGLGVPQSYASAFSWYEVAAEKGDPVAIFNIGVLNDAGLGLRRNPDEAVDRYTEAAAKGVGRAAFNLALLYETGDGVEQDDRAAERYFKQAERLGIRAARAHLPGRRGVRPVDADDSDLPFNTIHTIGGGAPERRSADAAARIQSLALQGDPLALYDLAYHVEKGIGREADPHGAYMMYRKAASEARDERLKTAATAAAAHLEAAGHIQ